jgi:phosphoribosylaminoimidazole-succinocarboxamide synthase
MPEALLQSNIKSLPLLARGKVRDNYAVGDDRLLMVASDRICRRSTWSWASRSPARVSCSRAWPLFWFGRLAHVVPNHLTGHRPRKRRRSRRARPGARPLDAGQAPVAAADRGGGAGLPGGQRLEGVPAVAVGVRRGAAAGPGQRSRKLPEPIFTPATKAEAGAHDENISFEQTVPP